MDESDKKPNAIVIFMPEPYAVMRDKIKRRLQGKSGNQRIREIKAILNELSPIFKSIRSELQNELGTLYKTERSKSKGRSRRAIRKKSPQMVIVGHSGSNKDLMFLQLSGRSEESYSQGILLGSLDYNDVHIQLLLAPYIYSGIVNDNRELYSLLRTTDGLLIVNNDDVDFQMTIAELNKAGIFPCNRKKGQCMKTIGAKTFLPSLAIYEKEVPKTDLNVLSTNEIAKIRSGIYDCLGITRIYLTRTNKDGFTKPPLIFMDGPSTVEDVLDRLRISKTGFKYAKVWGPSTKYDGAAVGLKRELRDGDIVRIYSKIV